MTQSAVLNGLMDFLKESPTAFHAVENIRQMLLGAGFTELPENKRWELIPGGSYFTTRNGSSVIAFRVGTDLSDAGFTVTASHSDSPCFKIKENAEIRVRDHYMQLNTEGYGGMICSTWLDRPLSVAGRVLVRSKDAQGKETYESRLIDFGRDLVMIPNLAIHMNRKVNDGVAYNKQIDMIPLFGSGDVKNGEFRAMVAQVAGTEPENILGSDLYLYNRMAPTVWGAHNEFVSSGKLDDLECAYGTLQGFLNGRNDKSIQVYCCFDNEEVGSGTKQGADSTMLSDVLYRIVRGLGMDDEDYRCITARSFMLSCDNAHAVHPNHPEKTDVANCTYMNEGIVIKSHAGQKYTSDGVSMAVFRGICQKAGVPVQFFANRSDEAGGSTLGNIAMAHVSMNTVDLGLAQLAMHSSYETAGVKDLTYLKNASQAFYSSHFTVDTNGDVQVED
ncbi:MAG: M18 family aminopeptidase [Oscillospiraceae bacterium]|nr:M18 family aminopeptidase [Oscillospiraceae bacterium]